MATPGEKLAESLEKLKNIQDKGITAIKSTDLSRVHRERLMDAGFIKEVMRGWYIAIPQDEYQGESTSWFTSFWGFCSRYLKERYGNDYCVSAEQSLLTHGGNKSVPQQLIIRSPKGNNLPTKLLFNTSIFAMKSELPRTAQIEVKEGVRILNLPSSIVHCSASLFQTNSTDVRAALLGIKSASQLLELLLAGGHSIIAGRLTSAYRSLDRPKIANDILKTMKAAGYDIRETDPFQSSSSLNFKTREESIQVNRIRLIWHQMREKVIEHFPKAPGLPENPDSYMKTVEEIYVTDAYHSLSIERYNVSAELIERIRSGDWNPKEHEADQKQKDAMAARGYWQATQSVRKSLKRILNKENAGVVADEEHGDWFRELFAPSVASGILKPTDLAGYRNDQVYIGNSKHIPMNKEAVRDALPELFDLLKNEDNSAVRSVLGHFLFVYIHPYMDGNGRMGRFLMNIMLASGGYPWTVIPVEERDTYMRALEAASVNQDIEPFAKFLSQLVQSSMNNKPIAKM